jgi:hypothetical protein
MPSSYTTNKNIEKPANGDYNNTWSVPVNSDWDIIDRAFGGTTSLNAVGASGTVTLTTSQYQAPIIAITGTLTANVNYQLPAGVGGFWYIFNNTSGAFSILFSSAGGGSTVTLPQGFTIAVISDGTNIGLGTTNAALISSTYANPSWITSLAASKLTGVVPIANGGTNASTAGTALTNLGAAASGTNTDITSLNASAGIQVGTPTLGARGVGTINATGLFVNGVAVGVSGGSVSSVSGSGGTTGMTLTGGPITTSGTLTLGGTLGVANGGTGNASLTSGAVLIGAGTSAVSAVSPGTVGNVLASNGSAWVSQAPTSGGVSSFNTRTGAVTLSSSDVTSALGYTPVQPNGTGASGTWSISISGNAATATSATSATSATTATTATTANALNTSNNYQVNSIGVGTAGSGTAGEIRATNNVTAFFSSDARLKENVQPIQNALDIASAVGGKTFDWTDSYLADHGGADGYFVRKNDFGVIAQDVQAVFPLAVRERSDGTLAVDYEKLVAVAFAAIAELKAEVEALKNAT